MADMAAHPHPSPAGPRPLAGADLLLIGGSGGIGSALARRLAREGVGGIVAASPRPPAGGALPGIRHEVVNVADLASVQALAARLGERPPGIVINCAGVNGNQALFSPGDIANARREMEINYFGAMHVGQVFGSLLAARGGGTLLTLLSFLSLVNLPSIASYCASKAAAHSLNQALRAQLGPRGVRVCGVYPTAVDTAMSRGLQGSKMSAEELADAMVDFLQGEAEDLFPGEAAGARQAWLQDPAGFQKAMAGAG